MLNETEEAIGFVIIIFIIGGILIGGPETLALFPLATSMLVGKIKIRRKKKAKGL